MSPPFDSTYFCHSNRYIFSGIIFHGYGDGWVVMVSVKFLAPTGTSSMRKHNTKGNLSSDIYHKIQTYAITAIRNNDGDIFGGA